jgi:xylan 1,4-beta-xylosidase
MPRVLRPARLSFAFAVLLAGSPARPQSPPAAAEAVTIDATAESRPFPHFWEAMFGSGRASLSLRESYRNDLRAVKEVSDFAYVRFHAIFHDENGVYDEDSHGRPRYNFSYVDQIYDGLLSNRVRPFVEISFMPRKLARRQDVHPFWYQQIVAPPKDYSKWDDLVGAFARHLVERYGLEEVSRWYFEVWNEPNIDFWTGEPKQATYFELYDHTAAALKSVSPRLRVGGPSTAAADWVDDFLKHASENQVPVDFVSSHGYADDTVEHLFHSDEDVPMDQRVCRAIGKVRSQIRSSSSPRLPLMWTEWNVSSFGDRQSRDTVYVGAALAETVRQCDGLVDMLSYWTFSDVFEENGPVETPFHGGFGLIAAGGIRKPSYNAYALLHRLGRERLPSESTSALATRREDGSLAIALWNLVDLDRQGAARRFDLRLRHLASGTQLRLTRLDAAHGNVLARYGRMGKPRYPTPAQIRELNRSGSLGPAEPITAVEGALAVTVPVNGLYLLEALPPRRASAR